MTDLSTKTTMELRQFPVCNGMVGGLKKTIPWSVAEKAYAAYCARYGGSQSLERMAERGGFYESELDHFYPKWREDTEELHLLRAEVKELRSVIAREKQRQQEAQEVDEEDMATMIAEAMSNSEQLGMTGYTDEAVEAILGIVRPYLRIQSPATKEQEGV